MTDTGAGTPLTDRLENDIRELRGAEPGELARRLVERGWSRPATDPAGLTVARLAQVVFDHPGSLAVKSWRTYPEAEEFAAAILARLSVADDSCPCGHSDDEHVHYCSADVDRGVCPCNAEYARQS